MRLGKLTEEELKGFLSNKNVFNKEVLVSSRIGEDCSLLKTEDFIAITTDPITITQADIGFKAITVCVNDLASAGAVPFAATVTLLAPPDCSVEKLKSVNDDIAREAAALRIDVVGGHTEFTDAVNRIVVSITMLGRTEKFFSACS